MTRAQRPDYAAEIRGALRNPIALCADLDMLTGAKKYHNTVVIRCPSPDHRDSNASCNVRLADDGGWIAAKCHSCQWGGDALTLIAVAKGLDLKSDFPLVLLEGAKLAGLHHVVKELETGEVDEDRPNVAPQRHEAAPEAVIRPYPALTELEALWRDSGAVADDADASGALVARRIDPLDVDRLGLAVCFRREIARDRLPRWASYQGQTWRDTGHRMLVRAYDCDGEWRSVRAWRLVDGSAPKRLPPSGHKAAGLVLANRLGAALLRGERVGRRILMVEGEPDHLVRSIVNPLLPVLGILSGSWHAGFAKRVPLGSEVVIRTHADQAGDRYAEQILETIRDRAHVYRLQAEVAA